MPTLLTQPSWLRSARLVAAGALLAVASATGVAVWAYGGPPPGGPMMGLPLQGRMLDHMLDTVSATADQRTQIKQIADQARADLKAQRDTGRSLHQQAMTLFTQTTVDAAAAETLRQQMLVQQDQASRRMLQAMLDVSRVLTPAQRQTLATQMAKHGEMMERHARERADVDGTPTR